MNKKENIERLVDRFFAGETTLAEEQRLYRYFRGDEVAADLLPLREMFVSLGSIGIAADEQTPAKSVETGRLKVGFGRRIIRVAAAIATLLLMITAALRIDREQNYCKAYVNDKLVTDQSAIMSHVAGTMNAIDEAGQTGVESQLNDIFGHHDTPNNP